MKKITYSLLAILFISSCGNPIKNEEAEVKVEKGVEIDSSNDIKEEVTEIVEVKETVLPPSEESDYIGYWVGYFLNAEDNSYEKNIYADEAFMWNRENKINISIEYIKDSTVKGRSIVAGNDRPFEGSYIQDENGAHFTVKEPGDDKYDGEFTFDIQYDELKGTWQAYKKIDISKRKYTLEKKEFKYDPEIMLEYNQDYIDWQNYKETSETIEYDDDEFEEWVTREFATATNIIYELNASTTKLSEEDVENLKKGDLVVIRNTIYARHGYSFKHRPLRVFFDRQKWYIPVSTDIKNEFTDLEKANIELLLKYEKNAAEYYDYFGRG